MPIPETKPVRPGHERPYTALVAPLAEFGLALPPNLADDRMHLDPDFEHLTYGDRGPKGAQIAGAIGGGDILVFYAGLMDVHLHRLVYALIGMFVVERIVRASDVPDAEAHCNAHTRRQLGANADDWVVFARHPGSGRLEHCLAVGEYRDRAYRVREDLLDAWGGISSRNGFLQRSAVFPALLQPQRFLDWWSSQNPQLVRSNNLR